MPINLNIQRALNKYLNTMTPTMSIAWENVKFIPNIGTPYLRTWLLPGETMPITLGPDCFEQYVGVFQIDCLYPIEHGWEPAKSKANAICTRFRRGTMVTYSTTQVTIMRSYPDAADIDGDYYKVPVTVVYRAFSNV